MKIVDVTLTTLHLPLPHPGLRPGWLGGVRHYSTYPTQLLRVFTDEGITGIALSEGLPPSTIDSVRAALLQQDLDPFDIEHLSRSIRGFPAGIEIALLDIAGKLVGKPIYKLLGGYLEKVLAYAATINLKDPDARAKDAVAFLEAGFKAIKLRAHFPDSRKDLAVIKAVRDAVGDDMDIMVDANQASHRVPPIWSHRTAFQMARALENLDVFWLEEPLHRDDLDGLAELTTKMETLMIAGAEGESSLRRFRHLLEKGCFDIIQPDTIHAGIYNGRKIAVLAEAYDALMVPHTHSICGLGLASSLQLIGSTPNCPYVEFGYEPPIVTPEHRDRILTKPIPIDNEGYVHIPQGPGLGVDLNDDFINQHTVP
jgi:D-galactarolactone cycloisomerase